MTLCSKKNETSPLSLFLLTRQSSVRQRFKNYNRKPAGAFTKRRRRRLSGDWNKLPEKQWFRDDAATDTDDCLEKQKVFKFRADLAFRKGNYQKSLKDYASCLALIPDGNQSIRRDVLEAMARCLSHTGQLDEALDTVEQLRKEATNTCHLTCLLLLKANIYQCNRDLRNQVAALQQLCCLHPYNQWHWAALAEGYVSLLQQGELQDVAGLTRGAPDRGDSNSVWLKACMCLVRARLLLRILRSQQSSFVLQSSERALQRMEEALQHLRPPEETLQLITEVMEEDLVPERMREDNQDGESVEHVSLTSFEDRWWNRLAQAGPLAPLGAGGMACL